ncbi:10601_t:CDS:2 [Diversispora eburnea]|uniref:10601_t:CDS:1 n=1 Tax=Diversispora eburnea TaxID=1213867 RepID=A0A9N8ZPV0_9GLOM|nr:10601_t:CDS:2 [Diversispora eburnea]
MENGSRRPRRSTAIYGTRLNELDTTRRTLKLKATSSLATRNIIANTYGPKASTIAYTSNLNKETKTTETNTNNMELLPVKENLLLNQDSIGEENTDNNMKAIDNTKKDEKGKGKEIFIETEKENNETSEQNITNTETDDNELVNSENSFLREVHGKNLKEKIDMISNLLNKNEINIIIIKTEKNLKDKKLYIAIYLEKKEDMEKVCKIEIEEIQLNDRSTLTRAAINQNKKTNNEKGIKFWNIPIDIQEQEFKSIIKNKFGNVTLCSISTRGLWSSAIVQFKKEDTAENLLME